jgi:hypothetical protein
MRVLLTHLFEIALDVQGVFFTKYCAQESLIKPAGL